MAYPGYPDYYHTDPYGGRSYPAPYPSRDVAPYKEPKPPRDPMPYPHHRDPRDARIVTQQPRFRPGEGQYPLRDWHSGLFDCMDDVKTCLCVWCCSPFYECYLAEKFGESWLNILCLGPMGTFLALRYKIRNMEKIEGSLLEDCFTTTFCYACSVCQLKRERDHILRTEGRLI